MRVQPAAAPSSRHAVRPEKERRDIAGEMRPRSEAAAAGDRLRRSFTFPLSCRCVLWGTVVGTLAGQCIVASPITGTPEAPGLLTLSRRRASFSRLALI